MAMIWGFGAPLASSARPKYSLFLHDTIQKVFTHEGNNFDFKKRIDISLFPKATSNLFSVFFETKNSIWHRWDYEVDQYDILGDKEMPIEVKPEANKDDESDGQHSAHSGG